MGVEGAGPLYLGHQAKALMRTRHLPSIPEATRTHWGEMLPASAVARPPQAPG